MFDFLDNVSNVISNLTIEMPGGGKIECSDWLAFGVVATAATTVIVCKDEIKEVVKKVVD